MRPASATITHSHAVVEAQEVAAANGVQQEIVAAKGLARIFASELGVEAEWLFERPVWIGVPVDEQNDSRWLDVRSRLGLDSRSACKRHLKCGRVPGMGLGDEVARVEWVRREPVELAEEVAKRCFHGRCVRAVPEHAQHGLALVAGRRATDRSHEDSANAAGAFQVGQGHWPTTRQVLMRQHAVGGEAVGQVEVWEVHAGG